MIKHEEIANLNKHFYDDHVIFINNDKAMFEYDDTEVYEGVNGTETRKETSKQGKAVSEELSPSSSVSAIITKHCLSIVHRDSHDTHKKFLKT